MCMCVCMCLCVRVCVCLCVSLCVLVYVCACVCACARYNTCTRVRMRLCVHVGVFECVSLLVKRSVTGGGGRRAGTTRTTKTQLCTRLTFTSRSGVIKFVARVRAMTYAGGAAVGVDSVSGACCVVLNVSTSGDRIRKQQVGGVPQASRLCMMHANICDFVL